MVKPVIYKDMAIYNPAEELHPTRVATLAKTIVNSLVSFKSMQLGAVLVSLGQCQVLNANVIRELSTALDTVQKKLGIITGFCCYDSKQYKVLKQMMRHYRVSLFKHREIAALLLGTPVLNERQVLLYDEDKTQLQLMAAELMSHGHPVVIAADERDFRERAHEMRGNALLFYETFFGSFGNAIPSRLQNNVVIYILEGFLESRMFDDFDYLAMTRRASQGFRVFAFDATQVTGVNPQAAEFFISLVKRMGADGAIITIFGLSEEKVPHNLAVEMERLGIQFYLDEESLFYDEELMAAAVSGLRRGSEGKLTKTLVAKLPIFVDAALETFQSLTGAESTKKSHKITPLGVAGDDSIVSSVISFSGEINGKLILLLSRPLTKRVMAMILGEESDDEAELVDGMKEFANIIAGRAKAMLAERGVSISISLPDAYAGLEEVEKAVGDRQGVQIELEMEGETIFFFLTG